MVSVPSTVVIDLAAQMPNGTQTPDPVGRIDVEDLRDGSDEPVKERKQQVAIKVEPEVAINSRKREQDRSTPTKKAK